MKRVTKASKETVYSVEKGCPTYWTSLLILKAKYGWSDCSFNDLLHLLSWVLPQPNSVPANTYQAKKVISPLTMGVEKKSMHAPTTVYFFVAKCSSHWINVPGVGPAGTRTMTFTVETKPPWGKRGIRRVRKRWYKNLSPQRTLY